MRAVKPASIVEEPVKKEQASLPAAKRLVSLDVFRGITVAAMILVNNPGSSAVYTPLDHAEWNGWTPTDLIFPFFLFIVGVSISLAFAKKMEQGGNRRELMFKILKRTVIIFGIGLLMAAFPYFHISQLRIPGVLQRIAICYFFASIIALNTKPKTQIAITVVLLLGYWGMMMLIPVPGFGAGNLGKEGNLGAYIDRVILTPTHMWKQSKVFDPEGILSTLPAIATALIGVLTGNWLRTSNKDQTGKVKTMILAGAIGIIVGLIWGRFFPINKALWTSSYVVFTAGMALCFLALCYWVIEIKNYRKWSVPFLVFGMNAIVAFVLSGILPKLIWLWHIPRIDGRPGNLQNYIYERLFLRWESPINASLSYAILFDLVLLFLTWLLYRKKIFIKV
ncbi:MAG TPA: heparan-alpha-glucosaminide N-acetyltransferase domain-containing protein [Blastocatellia bacterium]|nr:heparan-alpha-glucosaminide N-acetyltransferase domain-containing protein [Blastocatellia bacterium]